MGTIRILEETSKNPITLMGECAGIAYNSNTANKNLCYKIGLNCIKSGHGRVLEFGDIFFELDGYSARVIREFMRHVGDGLTVVQGSTRYINYSDFDYVIPPSIEKSWDTTRDVYVSTMYFIRDAITTLVDTYNVPVEDASMLLPLGMTTRLSVKKNARTIMNMAEQRLCTRTYWEYRQLMKDFEKALREYSEEWNTLCDYIFVCKCDRYGYCIEEKCCGKYETKFDK